MADPNKKYSAIELTKSLLFRTLTYRAAGFLGKPLLLLQIAKKSLAKGDQEVTFQSVADSAIQNLRRLVRLVTAYATGTYRGVSKKNAALVVAALLYFLSPIDIVPDFLPFVGFLDDVTLITWVLATLGTELSNFEDFENTQVDRLAGMSYQDLYERAKSRDVEGRSGMSKQELVDALGNSAPSAN